MKAFWGYSFNAVKTQIYIAMITYLMVIIVKHLCIDSSAADGNITQESSYEEIICKYNYCDQAAFDELCRTP